MPGGPPSIYYAGPIWSRRKVRNDDFINAATLPGMPPAVGAAHSQGQEIRKTFLMLVCVHDGRHFRGFINARSFVDKVLSRLEGHTPLENSGNDLEDGKKPPGRSKTNLEPPL